MKRVAIVDYGLCNLDSVRRAVEECGAAPELVDAPAGLRGADAIILPGVGAFGDAMRNLQSQGLEEALHGAVLDQQVPFLGICLGMQLMASAGTEGGETKGLGWIDGTVERLPRDGPDTRIPHVGWNEVRPTRASPLFRDIAPGRDFYFVHSYHLVPGRAEDALARTPYAGGFVSAVQRETLFGVQFHPEKSQRAGFQVLRNFLAV